MRLDAFRDIFRQLAVIYSEAVLSEDKKAAQESAAAAVSVISGLFPDQEDDAHKVISALLGALIAARSGSSRHILLRPGLRVSGTKGGLGAACIAAGAVAAVLTLEARNLSKHAARKRVAQILSDVGYSRRRGEHDLPVLITSSAIRSWEERPEHNPLVVALLPEYRNYIEKRIAAEALVTADQVAELLERIAPQFVQNYIAI